MSGEGFKTYLEFRNLVVECESFNEIIQRRVKDAEKSGDKTDLQEQLDELSARQITLAINASLKIFCATSLKKNLPLGSRDIFIRELNDLHRMKKNFDNDRLKGKVDAAALEDQRKVEEILNVVIEKAPQLFSFENMDDDDTEDDDY